jgi:chorismate mutase
MTKTEKKLKALRKQVDLADRELVRALGTRQATVTKIGKLKAKAGMTALQKSRWEKVLAAAVKHGQKWKLDPEFTKDIFNRIHGESIRIQTKVKKS